MTIEQLAARLPDHARDLRINLGAITGSTALAPAQAWTIAVASAVTTRHPDVIAAITGSAAAHLTPEALEAARGAAAIMGMTNIYYRFVHFTGDEYSAMPARLRMQLLARPGIAQLDFELACLAASAITGCERCVRAHDKSVRDHGGSKAAIQDAVRIAAIVHGVAVALAA
jgi:alkyl hydroperoxide reductase subunit D